MPQFSYEGVDGAGKKIGGKVEASSLAEARKLLRAQGIKARRVTPPSILEFDLSEWMVDHGLAAPFGAKELGLFTKQLSIMINAGVPIIQALEILYKSEKHPVLKKTIIKLAEDVGAGKTIAEALSQRKGFSKLYVSLVKAGESGGILDTILEKLNSHMEKQEKTKKQIKSAMTYPVIVCIVGAAVIWGMMIFVVPQFVDMLASTGQEPPWITAMVMKVSAFLGNNGLLLMGGIVAAIAGLKAAISTDSGKEVFDKVMMNLPIFGIVVIKGSLASFSRTLSTMLGSGVPLIDSLEICIETIDQTVIVKDLKNVREAVVTGKSLSEPLTKVTYFPEMVVSMLRVGEQTGNIDDMLEKISDVFETEVDEAVENMTKMIEPIIIVVLGSIVATILVAMYLPIFMSAGGSG
jgi:type IV pilus assembly protein PilC